MNIAQALTNLEVTEWVLRGDPTTEAEFNESFSKVVDGVESNDPADFGVTWAQVSTESDAIEAAKPLKELRAERDRLIAETDWWASSDLTMTAEQTTYRQALRDITDTYNSLDTVVWPTKP